MPLVVLSATMCVIGKQIEVVTVLYQRLEKSKLVCWRREQSCTHLVNAASKEVRLDLLYRNWHNSDRFMKDKVRAIVRCS